MAKSLSVASIVEKNKLSSDVPFVVLLEIGVKDATGALMETIYLVRNSEDISYKGQVYTAYPFEISLKSESGSIPNIKLTAYDYSRAVQQRMQQYGGAVNSDVKVTVLNTDNLDGDPEIVEYFQVVASSVQGYVVDFSLGAENALAIQIPRRNQLKDRCGWKFGGADCGYVGALTTCDQSLQGANGCTAHGNEANFGGFPGIKSSGIRY